MNILTKNSKKSREFPKICRKIRFRKRNIPQNMANSFAGQIPKKSVAAPLHRPHFHQTYHPACHRNFYSVHMMALVSSRANSEKKLLQSHRKNRVQTGGCFTAMHPHLFQNLVILALREVRRKCGAVNMRSTSCRRRHVGVAKSASA